MDRAKLRVVRLGDDRLDVPACQVGERRKQHFCALDLVFRDPGDMNNRVGQDRQFLQADIDCALIDDALGIRGTQVAKPADRRLTECSRRPTRADTSTSTWNRFARKACTRA